VPAARLEALIRAAMSRICLLVHELAPPPEASAGRWTDQAWTLAQALTEAGSTVILLHSAPLAESARHALRHAARGAGAAYRHLDEFPAFSPLMILPAVPAHRLGLHVAEAIRALDPATVIVLDHPAHAAATAAARACGQTAGPARLILALAATEAFRREAAAEFPQAGRADLGADFLERAALAAADALVCGPGELRAWLRSHGQPVPADTTERAPLVAGADPAVRAHWLALAADGPLRPAAAPAPTIAVCVPYFEQPRYLAEALAGLAAQSAPPHEVVVVDDGSHSPAAREAFAAATRQFARPGWTFLRQDNAGPAAARNRAAAATTADVLIFCDADNRFRPEMVAALGRAIPATGADCVTCGFEAFSDPAAGSAPEAGYAFVPLGPCVELGLIENIFGDTNFAVRRSVFHALGGFPRDNRAASEDWQFLLQLVRRGHLLAVVPALLFDYRRATASHARRHSEWASALAAVGPVLAEADAAWRGLWPHAAGLVREPRAAQLEAEFADARLRFAQTEATLRQRDRMRRAHVVLVESAITRHQEEVRIAQAAAAEQWRQNAVLTEETAAQIASLERGRQTQEDKVRRMQAAFSWRVTAPLRALRRAWLDRAPTPPPVEAAVPAPRGRHFRHHLDAPRQWSRHQSSVIVRGWCFAEEPGAVQAIRARVGARTYPGAYGGERPDLPVVFPQWPQSGHSGFKIEIAILPGDAAASLEVQQEDGSWESFLTQPLSPAAAAATRGSYEHWVQTHDTRTAAELAALRTAAAALSPAPMISVLMPVYNPAERWLAAAIDSVLAQVYPHWELCLADDASTAPQVGALLARYAAADPRIKIVRREKNGHISAATNSALALATGEFAALLDQDDELAPHALYCIAAEIAGHSDVQLLYTDEDKLDEQGGRFHPHFKPDWNPDLLCGQNYLSHLAVYRTALLRALGGLREGFEGSQDWDLALRATERIPAAAIRHIPRVLYHWRANEGSTALHLGEKRYANEAARRTLMEHFARRGIAAEVRPTIGQHWQVTYPLPRPRPLVSVIIPTRNGAELLKVCLASLFARTNYAPYEILLINNRSDDPAALALLAEAAREEGVRVLDFDGPFNYSAINNFAVGHARGDVLCLLNNDIEVREPLWLDELVSHAVRPEIGAVGARLLYPDSRLQHAGVITGLGGVAGHAFKHFAAQEPGTPQFRPHLIQNLSVVTAACLAIRRELYLAVGGFDAEHLPIAFNDVDFCLKVEALGYRNLYTPFAELIHHESASRGREDSPEKIRRFQGEIAAIKRRWGDRLQHDPAYNPNLTLDSEDFAFAYPPRTPPLPPPA
jgi:glycosyltransferase involved in cell wall biosynthesis